MEKADLFDEIFNRIKKYIINKSTSRKELLSLFSLIYDFIKLDFRYDHYSPDTIKILILLNRIYDDDYLDRVPELSCDMVQGEIDEMMRFIACIYPDYSREFKDIPFIEGGKVFYEMDGYYNKFVPKDSNNSHLNTLNRLWEEFYELESANEEIEPLFYPYLSDDFRTLPLKDHPYLDIFVQLLFLTCNYFTCRKLYTEIDGDQIFFIYSLLGMFSITRKSTTSKVLLETLMDVSKCEFIEIIDGGIYFKIDVYKEYETTFIFCDIYSLKQNLLRYDEFVMLQTFDDLDNYEGFERNWSIEDEDDFEDCAMQVALDIKAMKESKN